MATAAIVTGVLALVGYLVLLITGSQTAWLFWVSAIVSVIALIAGVQSRSDRNGMIGLVLGIVGIVAGIVIFLALSPFSAPPAPAPTP